MTVKHWNTGASAVRFRDQAGKRASGRDKMKTTGQGWINAYYENKLDDLPLGYIKKVEALFTEMGIKMCEPQESNRLDGGTKYEK